jgi:hypothetical protein
VSRGAAPAITAAYSSRRASVRACVHSTDRAIDYPIGIMVGRNWLLALHVIVLELLSDSNALDNGLARTPPMGWM